MSASELQAFFAKRSGWRATEVVAGKLWLGSGGDAAMKCELRARGITDIINVADDVPNYHLGDAEAGFRYINLGVADFGQDKGIARVFPAAVAAVREVLDTPSRAAFVHCAAGQNRSVTVVLAVLMQLQRATLHEAYTQLKAKRGYICPLKDNREALVAYEESLHGRVTMGVHDFAEERNLRTAS